MIERHGHATKKPACSWSVNLNDLEDPAAFIEHMYEPNGGAIPTGPTDH
jgi:hypothetical protein